MRFDWTELRARADELLALGPFRAHGSERFALTADGATLRLPPAVPAPGGLWDAPDWGAEPVHVQVARRARGADVCALRGYLEALPEELPLQWMVLLQAGATALAVLDAGEPVVTKSFKRYVVRGNGRAQPTHLRVKGKSRYGARLRLQNAKRQLEETSERLRAFHAEFGAPRQVLYGAPKRLWADYAQSRPAPPFDGLELVRIPFDLAVPTTEVLLDAYARLRSVDLSRD
ncbi:MAG: hypothetical protein AAFZ87_10280 [Planctomycetota bacterium]